MTTKPVYLDYNATTPVDKEVLDEMMQCLGSDFGNPSSSHYYGNKAKQTVNIARKRVAALLNCDEDEVIFTSGGSESNNLAIKGAAQANKHKGRHIITTAIEHPAVLEVCRNLEENGFSVDYLPVDEEGRVDPQDVEKAIKADTIFITVMHANNETGILQPIREISLIARNHGILIHTDAAQTVGKIETDVKELGVDMLSVAGHKFYGPKGVGAMYIRRGVRIEKATHGANHEMNLRPGTENVASIAGLGRACEIAAKDLKKNTLLLNELTSLFLSYLNREFPSARLIGHTELRLPNTLNISFPGLDASAILAKTENVAASAGAACHADRTDVSYVLKAMNLPEDLAMGCIRFSFGKYLTRPDVEKAAEAIVRTVRSMQYQHTHKTDDFNDIRLTAYTTKMGCSCKTNPKFLKSVLDNLGFETSERILVNASCSDDAAVFAIDGENVIVQTVDFITPVVDDPYTFGAIAMSNSVSDIYAMGAEPAFALNIVAFPDDRLPESVLNRMLQGAGDKAREAGIPILGGHTIHDHEPKLGMSVTGFANKKDILRNSTAKPGDILVLTKPLGTGLVLTAHRNGQVDKTQFMEVLESMLQLNRVNRNILRKYDVHACTDITGFGLLGHLREMIEPARLTAEIRFDDIPLFEPVKSIAASGIKSGGYKKILEYVSGIVDVGLLSEITSVILADPQTSGGLMFALPQKYAGNFTRELADNGFTRTAVIGRVLQGGNPSILIN